jgi:alpha-mannosidase
MPGLADHLAAPPLAYAHLPYDSGRAPSIEPLLDVRPASIRLLACKRSWDGEALIVRLQEAVGRKTKARLGVAACAALPICLDFKPFEIKTLRVERNGTWRAVRMIGEDKI